MHTTMGPVAATGALRRRPAALSAAAVGAVLAALSALLLAFGPLARPAGAAGAVGAGYWHTSGSQILDSNGNVVKIAGVNHLFLPATTGEVDEYGRLTGKEVSPELPSALAAWLSKTLK